MSIKVRYLSDIEPIGYTGGQISNWIDLRASKTVTLKKGEFAYIPLGVAIELPEGYEAIVAPRSSTFKRHHVLMTNSIGVIDQSYCGDDDQWHFPAYAVKDTVINKNDRICQFRIIKSQGTLDIETVEHLGNKNRGGLGSTGKD